MRTRLQRDLVLWTTLPAFFLALAIGFASLACGTMTEESESPRPWPLASSVMEQAEETDEDLIQRSIEEHNAAFPVPLRRQLAEWEPWAVMQALAEHDALLDALMATWLNES